VIPGIRTIAAAGIRLLSEPLTGTTKRLGTEARSGIETVDLVKDKVAAEAAAERARLEDKALSILNIADRNLLHLLARVIRYHGGRSKICTLIGVNDLLTVRRALTISRGTSLFSEFRAGTLGFAETDLLISSRRLQREKATANVWPPSPKAPARDL
jgi:hypothetical protein